MMQLIDGYYGGRSGYTAATDGQDWVTILKEKLGQEGRAMQIIDALTGGQLNLLKEQAKAKIAADKGKLPAQVTELEIAEYLANLPTQGVADAVQRATERKLGDIGKAIVAAAVIGGLFYYLGSSRRGA